MINKHRLFGLLMAVMMVFTMIPTNIFAADVSLRLTIQTNDLYGKSLTYVNQSITVERESGKSSYFNLTADCIGGSFKKLIISDPSGNCVLNSAISTYRVNLPDSTTDGIWYIMIYGSGSTYAKYTINVIQSTLATGKGYQYYTRKLQVSNIDNYYNFPTPATSAYDISLDENHNVDTSSNGKTKLNNLIKTYFPACLNGQSHTIYGSGIINVHKADGTKDSICGDYYLTDANDYKALLNIFSASANYASIKYDFDTKKNMSVSFMTAKAYKVTEEYVTLINGKYQSIANTKDYVLSSASMIDSSSADNITSARKSAENTNAINAGYGDYQGVEAVSMVNGNRNVFISRLKAPNVTTPSSVAFDVSANGVTSYGSPILTNNISDIRIQYIYEKLEPTPVPTPKPTPTPAPVLKKPTLGIDAYPLAVKVNENYIILDNCQAYAPATGISSYRVKKEKVINGVRSTVLGETTITNSEDFFKTNGYSETEAGDYIYTITEIKDNKGTVAYGTASVTVTVSDNAKPILGIGADKKNVKVGEVYNILDKCQVIRPAISILKYTVKKEKIVNGVKSSVLPVINITSSTKSDFFKPSGYSETSSGDYVYTITYAMDNLNTEVYGAASVTVTVTDNAKPVMDIDAYPKSVILGDSYTVNDLCQPQAPATSIVEYTVRKEKSDNGVSTIILGDTTLTAANKSDFFKSYTENSSGDYTYYITHIKDNLGSVYDGSVSVTITVDNPTPTAAPSPTPGPNLPPKAVITAPDTVLVNSPVTISGLNSTDSDGKIVVYNFSLTGTSENISSGSGEVTYTQTGQFSIRLVVVDDAGDSDTAIKYINVVAAQPTPVISVTGKTKQFRVYNLDSSHSISEYYPIDHTKTEWTIRPVNGSGATNEIYIITFVNSEGYQDGDKYSGMFNKISQDMGCRDAGDYDVTLKVYNTGGYSASTTLRITIQKDLPPVAVAIVPTSTIRDIDDGNGYKYAQITLIDDSYSPDGDVINRRKWTYKYDYDNDGDFNDEQEILISDGNELTVSINTSIDGVGKYQFGLTVYEDLKN